MTARELIKAMAKSSRYKLKDLALALDMKHPQTLNNKLYNNTLRYSEMEKIAKLTGYEIIVQPAEVHNTSIKLQELVYELGNGGLLSFLFDKVYMEGSKSFYVSCEDIVYEDSGNQLMVTGNIVCISENIVEIFYGTLLIIQIYLDKN